VKLNRSIWQQREEGAAGQLQRSHPIWDTAATAATAAEILNFNQILAAVK
jgi:hypothetical protein